MRIVAFSDIHRHFNIKVPDGDVLIFAGDSCFGFGDKFDMIKDLTNFNEFIGSLSHKHKLVVAGNHDKPLQKNPNDIGYYLSNCIYLQDREIVLHNVKFYGSPWLDCYDWAFSLPGELLSKRWKRIPDDVNVLITHSPPYGILDEGGLGGEDLLKRVKQLNLKLHIFGHCHRDYGKIQIGDKTFANVALCDVDYKIVNTPMIFDI